MYYNSLSLAIIQESKLVDDLVDVLLELVEDERTVSIGLGDARFDPGAQSYPLKGGVWFGRTKVELPQAAAANEADSPSAGAHSWSKTPNSSRGGVSSSLASL